MNIVALSKGCALHESSKITGWLNESIAIRTKSILIFPMENRQHDDGMEDMEKRLILSVISRRFQLHRPNQSQTYFERISLCNGKNYWPSALRPYCDADACVWISPKFRTNVKAGGVRHSGSCRCALYELSLIVHDNTCRIELVFDWGKGTIASSVIYFKFRNRTFRISTKFRMANKSRFGLHMGNTTITLSALKVSISIFCDAMVMPEQ